MRLTKFLVDFNSGFFYSSRAEARLEMAETEREGVGTVTTDEATSPETIR